MSRFFRPTGSNTNWSNVQNWNGHVPLNQGAVVVLEASGNDDLGTALHPFVTAYEIGVATVGVLPSMGVTGFLHTGAVVNVASLTVGAGAFPHGQIGDLRVSDSLYNVGSATVSTFLANGSSTLEIGHGYGNTTFTLTTLGQTGIATLILDHPTKTATVNHIEFDHGRLEMGVVQFDGAQYVSDTTGGSPHSQALAGKLLLTEHGQVTYTLAHVGFNPTGPFTVGVDPVTHLNFVQV
jgi:hypothetical protein